MECAIVEKELKDLGLNKGIFMKALKKISQTNKLWEKSLPIIYSKLFALEVTEDDELMEDFYHYEKGLTRFFVWFDILKNYPITSITDEA